MVNFPAPIGGTVLPSDFAPSILFAVLYGLLFPLVIYRILHRRSRNTLMIGTTIFTIERVVVYALRAAQAHSEKKRFTNGLVTYMQVSFGLGYIGFASDLVGLLRCLLVNPTYGPERYPESAAAATKDGVLTAPPEGYPDMKKARFWVRRFAEVWGFAFLAATVPGIIANSQYHKVLTDQKQADKTATMRVASTAIAFAFTYVVFAFMLWGRFTLPRISQKGVAIITSLTIWITVISIYRLSVMSIRTTSLTEPTPLNSSRGKAAFYVCHVLPEYLACLSLFVPNVRKIFGTGFFGDWRGVDETEKEKEKRLNSEAKKAAKKSGLPVPTTSEKDNNPAINGRPEAVSVV